MVEQQSAANKHYKISFQGKKYDTREQIANDMSEPFDNALVEEVTLGGNSYGREACDHISEVLKAASCTQLKTVNFDNMFVSRKLQELPGSLEVLVRALMESKIEHINMSDNAFGPAGIKSFDFFLKGMSTLRTLKVTNCGLGPEGGEMIAAALSENTSLRLQHFSAGRDRLENKGITALAGVFKAMGSLEVIEVPQNGIKKEGMVALLESLKANATSLREVYLHDNWIKGEANERLVEFVLKAERLETLNVSDSTMGTQAALLLAKALAQPEAKVNQTLKHFACNYNEVESVKASKMILETLLSDQFASLQTVEFKGNSLGGRKAAQSLVDAFAVKGRKLVVFEEDEDQDDLEEDDEDGEGAAEDDEDVDEEDILKKLEKLKI